MYRYWCEEEINRFNQDPNHAPWQGERRVSYTGKREPEISLDDEKADLKHKLQDNVPAFGGKMIEEHFNDAYEETKEVKSPIRKYNTEGEKIVEDDPYQVRNPADYLADYQPQPRRSNSENADVVTSNTYRQQARKMMADKEKHNSTGDVLSDPPNAITST